MKKMMKILITIIFACTLAGCSNNGDSIKEVESIIDTAEEEGACFMCAEERFYEDDNYIYTFAEAPMSQYIIVRYTNGSKQNVTEALEDGNITITDLDTYGIRYGAEPKHISWLGETFEDGPHEAIDEAEEIYRDDKYIYYLPTKRSEFMKVYYKDETEQDLKSALSEGKIRITDLDCYDVDYYRVPLNKIQKYNNESDWNRASREFEDDNSIRMAKKRYPTILDNCVLVWSEEEIAFNTSKVAVVFYYLNEEYEENRYEYYIQYETIEDAIEAVEMFENDEFVIMVQREETKSWVG